MISQVSTAHAASASMPALLDDLAHTKGMSPSHSSRRGSLASSQTAASDGGVDLPVTCTAILAPTGSSPAQQRSNSRYDGDLALRSRRVAPA